MPVHPRWRGEHICSCLWAISRYGSSPLARGTRIGAGKSSDSVRFIPAGAGNTRNPARRRQPAAVHPRWRGEHQGSPDAEAWRPGSSPLARGTLVHPRLPGSNSRFIPAGAGNTKPTSTRPSLMPVHPRWRGEHAVVRAGNVFDYGSSPLARGTLQGEYRRSAYPRFIPAGAGNTLTPVTGAHPMTVHPRWRGEHGLFDHDLKASPGSSPLARGTLIPRLHVPAAQRFIPAGAGNTSMALAQRAKLTVHPRWRGEHAQGGRGGRQGFIPAGAGNT
ncbi:Domain of uncharacterised function (DUF2825) [Ectopseudomonas oleovorans]|uniref:Domain of uncharacterized function (DUF2825) n=1 Tax=Ectopseudomonas oleovorans TaxID=301 RepID=A0A379JP73_ECTOL|nr:Domain of uncharacterised function (DUF2825) [Pseudomonas oleovorans]